MFSSVLCRPKPGNSCRMSWSWITLSPWRWIHQIFFFLPLNTHSCPILNENSNNRCCCCVFVHFGFCSPAQKRLWSCIWTCHLGHYILRNTGCPSVMILVVIRVLLCTESQKWGACVIFCFNTYFRHWIPTRVAPQLMLTAVEWRNK